MADDVWPDNPSSEWTPEARDKFPPLTETTPTQVPAQTPAMSYTAPAGGGTGGFGRDASLVATGALGVPGDVIYTAQPAINWLTGKLGISDTGPQIPIPTTEYIRHGLGVAPPSGNEEVGSDITGKAIGTALTSRVIPGSRGGAMLSAGAGAGLSGLSEQYFPDSVALQLLAGGVGGLATTAIARRLLFGGPRGLMNSAMGLGGAFARDALGRLIGTGVAHLTGLPEVLGAEVGGIAGLLSHSAGRAVAHNVFSPAGLRGAVAGTIGAIPQALQTHTQADTWPDNPLTVLPTP